MVHKFGVEMKKKFWVKTEDSTGLVVWKNTKGDFFVTVARTDVQVPKKEGQWSVFIGSEWRKAFQLPILTRASKKHAVNFANDWMEKYW
jgi:hypothetical protein